MITIELSLSSLTLLLLLVDRRASRLAIIVVVVSVFVPFFAAHVGRITKRARALSPSTRLPLPAATTTLTHTFMNDCLLMDDDDEQKRSAKPSTRIIIKQAAAARPSTVRHNQQVVSVASRRRRHSSTLTQLDESRAHSLDHTQCRSTNCTTTTTTIDDRPVDDRRSTVDASLIGSAIERRVCKFFFSTFFGLLCVRATSQSTD